MNNREPVLRREERFLKKTKTIVSRPMKRFIAIDGSDRASVDESSLHLVRRIFIVRLDLIGD